MLAMLEGILAQKTSRESKAKSIADAIRHAGPYRWVGVYDVDIDRGVVSNIAWSGPNAPEHLTFPVTKGLTSRAIVSKKTINVHDVASDPDYLTAFSTTRSELIVPVLDHSGSRVLGTIDVESEHPNAFDATTQTLVEQCAKVLRRFWQTC